MKNRRKGPVTSDAILWLAFTVGFILLAVSFAGRAISQEIAYCKHGQTGEVIAIEANMVCPQGYYRL